LIQYRSVTDTHTHRDTRRRHIPRLARRRAVKITDYMLVLFQKLHILQYHQQNFSGDRPPFRDPCPKNEGARTVSGWDHCF